MVDPPTTQIWQPQEGYGDPGVTVETRGGDWCLSCCTMGKDVSAERSALLPVRDASEHDVAVLIGHVVRACSI